MPNINQIKLLDYVIIMLIQFVAVFVGVYVKEYFNTKNRRVRIPRIIVVTIAISCLMVGFAEKVISQIGLPLYFTLSFLIGASSNTILQSIISGDLLKNFLKAVFYDAFTSIMESTNKNKKDDKNK